MTDVMVLEVGFKDGMGLKIPNSDDQIANLDERKSRPAGANVTYIWNKKG